LLSYTSPTFPLKSTEAALRTWSNFELIYQSGDYNVKRLPLIDQSATITIYVQVDCGNMAQTKV